MKILVAAGRQGKTRAVLDQLSRLAAQLPDGERVVVLAATQERADAIKSLAGAELSRRLEFRVRRD